LTPIRSVSSTTQRKMVPTLRGTQKSHSSPVTGSASLPQNYPGGTLSPNLFLSSFSTIHTSRPPKITRSFFYGLPFLFSSTLFPLIPFCPLPSPASCLLSSASFSYFLSVVESTRDTKARHFRARVSGSSFVSGSLLA
jgi:hypothetical protein